MMWMIEGGVHKDETFSKIKGEVERHGPYNTREEAEKAWKGYMFAQVDNCLHRLWIVNV